MFDDLVRFEQLRRPDAITRSVLFVTNMWPDETRPYYGSFIASQARSLASVGVAVDVLYIRGYIHVRAYLDALLAVPRAARRHPYDVIHVHYGHSALASALVLERPLIVSFCGEDLLGTPTENGITRKSRVEVAVFRQVARLATATITKSSEMEFALPRRIRARNYVIPNGVDLDVFAPMPRHEARLRLGWDADETVMLFLGDPDDPRKNVALARAAATIVSNEIAGGRLHVAWGIEPEMVPVVLNASDCLVFTSRSEGSPNAIKEAMACALPVVATPVGDIPERLEGVDNCFVCEPTPSAFAQAIIDALRGGRAPQARVAVSALGIGSVAHRLAEIYDAYSK